MTKKKSRCPVCLKGKAVSHPAYGLLPCKKCQKSFEGEEINRTHEFTSSSIKGERREYAASMLQPYVNGVLSREFIEAYGTSKLAGVTKQEIKDAKYVYKDLPRHHKIAESRK